jgi:DNA-packaging protein gp3
MPKSLFKSAAELQLLIDKYFNDIVGTDQTDKENSNEDIIKSPEPATITGLAFFLGFNSLGEFENYEERGKFKLVLKRGSLRIEAEYEKRLYKPAPQAAMFALKNRGWANKRENKISAKRQQKKMTLNLIETGPPPASNEKEVDF